MKAAAIVKSKRRALKHIVFGFTFGFPQNSNGLVPREIGHDVGASPTVEIVLLGTQNLFI